MHCTMFTQHSCKHCKVESVWKNYNYSGANTQFDSVCSREKINVQILNVETTYMMKRQPAIAMTGIKENRKHNHS